ncbi:hypothetical protein Slin15195_G044970 [Septoria linicola]|uniref:Rhodopsin domain-containing protein n=1 Tax=Septoria linicola TaxID=215465 RepID=A0A9Q9AS73_9PEZI|nr:hypothetical protein Slin15195_G044970 [Septoria linicola]
MTHAGLGQDIWQLPFDNITKILHFFWIGEFLYVWIMTMTKISIVVLYLRVWGADTRQRRDWFRFECNPISFAWTRWDKEHSGSCFDLNAQVFALAGVNIAQDLMVCLLPLPKLFAMSLPLKKKLVVVCIFLVGLFVTICSVIRLQYLVTWGSTDNPTWYYNSIALWSGIECTVAIICACLPAMAGLCRRVYRYSVGAESTTGYGSNASRHTKHRSGQVEHWHELNSPSYSVPTKALADHENAPPSYTEPHVRQVSGWD